MRKDEKAQLMALNCRGSQLDCRLPVEGGAYVMGILNVTPDSFFDGGKYLNSDTALQQGEKMIIEGARIIDVGGESTRPRGGVYGEGAEAVNSNDEKKRIVPVISALHRNFPDTLISVDTYKADVAREALEAGAHIINDVTGLRADENIATVAAQFDAPLILMHSLGMPGAMPHQHHYKNVLTEVKNSLEQACQKASGAGVKDLVIDPGFGFGKTPAENLVLINHLDGFLELGRPILIGLSRKSTIGHVLRKDDKIPSPDQRLFGSLGATAIAALKGASIIRTHDVGPTVEFLKVLDETRRASVH